MEEVRIMKSQYAAGRTEKAQATKDARSRLSMVKDCLILRSSRMERATDCSMFSPACSSQPETFPNLAGHYPDVINNKLGNEVTVLLQEAGSLMESVTACIVFSFFKKIYQLQEKKKDTNATAHCDKCS